jgi:tetratricopeptide (TPR) repeat protein
MVPAVAAPVPRPRDALTELRQRVAGALAAEVDPIIAALAREASQPPTYEAYLAWVDGVDRFSHRDFAGSVAPLMRAAALDSTFVAPALWAGAALGNSGNNQRADSVFKSLASKRLTFAPLDRGLFDVWVAHLNGDMPGEYAAAHEMLAASPGSELALFLAGLSAIYVNRPGEAVRILRRIPVERSGAAWNAYGTSLALALHLANRHREELAEARRRSAAVADWLPAMSDEARALAALGQLATLDSLIKRVASSPRQAGYSPASVMLSAGIELSVHGYPRQAADLFRRSAEWSRSRPESEMRAAGYRFTLARALYQAGDFAAADTVMAALVAQSPDNPTYLGYAGAIAAGRGDTAAADRASERLAALSQPYLFGAPSLGRARIAALLGRKAEAIQLLRRAMSEGSTVSAVHASTDFLRLRGYEPFEALLRPAG